MQLLCLVSIRMNFAKTEQKNVLKRNVGHFELLFYQRREGISHLLNKIRTTKRQKQNAYF